MATIDLAEYQYKLKLDSSEYSNNMKEAETQAESMKQKLSGVGDFIKTSLIALFTTLGTAAAGAAAALTNLSVQGAAYADEILTQSTVTGMSTESLQAYSYAADLVDVSLETLTGSMARNVKAMSEAASGSESYMAAYEKLGVYVTNADGSLRDSEAVYWEVIDALGTVANETERDAIAMELFGKSAQSLNPLISQGSAGIKELTAEAKSMGAVLSEESLNAFGAFDDNIQKLTQGSNAAKNALGGILLPQLTELSGVGVQLLGEFTSGMNAAGGDMSKISEVISNVLGSAISAITEKLPEFLNFGMEIVSSIASAISDNLPTLISAATGILTSLAQKLMEAIPEIMQTGIEVLSALVEGISSALPELIPTAVETITTLVTGIVEALPQLVDAGLQIITGLVDGLLAALPKLIEALPKIIEGIINFITESLPKIIEAGIKLFTSLVEALPDIIKQITAVLPDIIKAIITAIIDSIPLLIDAGVKLLVALVEALPEIIDAIVEAIPVIITSIVDALTGNIDKIIEAGVMLFIALVENLPKIIIELVKAIPKIIKALADGFLNSLPKMAEVGLNLIQGLWNGIKDAGAWLWEKISGFFSGIVDGIKDFFGIKSPSKLFEDEIGVNLAEGIGVGFEKTMSKVTDDMKDAMPTPDLFSIGEISLPKRSTISFLDTSQALNSSGSVNQKNDFMFEKMVDITFTGDINNDTLPKVEKLLKDIPGMVTNELVNRLSMKGVKTGALVKSF